LVSCGNLCKAARQINFDNRLAGTVMDKIIDFKVRKQALETAGAKNAAELLYIDSRNML
jgi:ribosomal 50S subunit-recycling heat shock protein